MTRPASVTNEVPRAASDTQLISVTEAAARLSCSRGHVYDLVAAGAFRLVDIGAGKRPKSRLYASELEAFIASKTRIA